MNANYFDLVSYVSSLVQLRKSGAYYIGPCPICGGRDRFNIKRAEADLWICRKCITDGKYHSAVDFVMQYHKLEYQEALKRMGLEAPRRPLGQIRPRSPYTPAPVQVVPDPAWQEKAWKKIDAANNLLISEAGKPGRDYLAARGISRGSIFMHSLGYGMVYGRPAIFIPWLDVGEVVTALRYRFLDNQEPKYMHMKGSLAYLFGLQHILPSDQTLLFVEGEINAISILQTLPRGMSIVSAGSESNGNAALLRALAFPYKRVIVWSDEPSKAKAISERMNRTDAQLLKSPRLDGKKWDASEMLQAGVLMDFVTSQFSVKCDGIPAPALFTSQPMEHDHASA
jgi:ribosomal protein L37AE/L43A